MPDLWDENKDAWELFQSLTNHLILGGMGGVAGYDLNALMTLMDIQDIALEDRLFMYHKVNGVFLVARKIWNTPKETR